MEEEEYEIVPLGPVRRLEKRLERIEKIRGDETIKDLIELVRTNQHVIDEIVKVNSDVVSKMSELSIAVNKLTGKVDNLVSKEKYEEIPREIPNIDRFEERLNKIEKRLNSLILMTMPKIRKAQ